MELEKLINDDIKQTMLARDSRKLDALRAIKAALLLEKTGKDLKWDGEIPEEVELKLLQKLVKMRRESAELYKSQNRPDLAEEELFQAGIIEKYLPAQMDEAEIETVIKAIITETGAQSIKDMGRVMGAATKKLAGKADNKAISEIIKRLLGS
ncbi:MAG TPA: GatB/YqeY domain-containing protein [Bacteroidales bacterium]|nr:GatB/YqeY domain-containing protein [Bacteroidales bacterium]